MSIMTPSPPRSELLRTHLKGFTRLLHQVEPGDVRAIHRTRVASRRLRELLPVLQIDPDLCARLLRDLRRATRALGRVRELDVTVQLIENLRPTLGSADVGLAVVSDRLRQARAVAHAKAARKGRFGDDLKRLAKRLERLVTNLRARGPREGHRWRWALEARIARRVERLTVAIERAGPFYLPEQVHGVRIALKKLRYALELDHQAGGATTAAAIGRFARAQELLGVLNDRQRLIEHLRTTQAALTARQRRASREIDTVIASLEDECRTLHARYVRQRRSLAEAAAKLVLTAQATATDQPVPARPSRRRAASR